MVSGWGGVWEDLCGVYGGQGGIWMMRAKKVLVYIL